MLEDVVEAENADTCRDSIGALCAQQRIYLNDVAARMRAVAVEDALPLVGEDVDATGLIVRAVSSGCHHASAKSWASSTTIESNR
jgi:hypothetical protein